MGIAWSLLCGNLPAGAEDPDFSGNWKLNRAESKIRAMPEPPSEFVIIEHHAPRLRCVMMAEENGPGRTVELNTGGMETRNTLGAVRRRSILKWEGDSLLLNTLVSGPKGQFTEMERWRLSRDGKVLRIRRQIVSRHGEMESMLVYTRQ